MEIDLVPALGPALRPLMADSVAKVGMVGHQRNVRSDETKFLNLSVFPIVTDESILRVLEPERLLQHYRHNPDQLRRPRRGDYQRQSGPSAKAPAFLAL